MKINERVDTILDLAYWENDKLLSRHANAITPELRQILKDIDELADLIIFHAKVRENAKIMSEPLEM